MQWDVKGKVQSGIVDSEEELCTRCHLILTFHMYNIVI